ncbi:hypothetical protein F4808DRAFT_420581 [Astrocystis sublimbata]|nr:hypothetical protein F4808DRAFT_420581 [Astrocystis sublimbata]
MQFSILTMATLVGAVSALTPDSLPESKPMITTAPKPNNVAAAMASTSNTATCSTNCIASYVECNGSLTFSYLCYTPPPCGTQTWPDPPTCPPPNTSTTATPTSSTSFMTVTVSGTDTTSTPTKSAVPTETYKVLL